MPTNSLRTLAGSYKDRVDLCHRIRMPLQEVNTLSDWKRVKWMRPGLAAQSMEIPTYLRNKTMVVGAISGAACANESRKTQAKIQGSK